MRARAGQVLFPFVFVVVVAALVFVFHGGVSANPASRALTVLGLAEVGTLSADPWANLTIDRAIVNGHTYSDKAPLSSFVVLPFYSSGTSFAGGRSMPRVDLQVLVLIGDVVAAAIPFGAFVLLLERSAARWMRGRDAVLFSLLAAFGTPLFSYGALYFGHALAGALFVFAYDAATREHVCSACDEPGKRASSPVSWPGSRCSPSSPSRSGAVSSASTSSPAPRAEARPRRIFARRAPVRARARRLQPRDHRVAVRSRRTIISRLPFRHAHPYVLDRHTFVVAGRLLFGQYRGLFFYAPALFLLFPARDVATRHHAAAPPPRRLSLSRTSASSRRSGCGTAAGASDRATLRRSS